MGEGIPGQDCPADGGEGRTLKGVVEALAQGLKIEIPPWSKTLAGGDIQERDIFRNYRRPEGAEFKTKEPRLTMQRALGPIGYRIVDAGNPTNPKERGKGENKMQLADLFLVNKYWKTALSGIVTSGKAELKPIDDPDLSSTNAYWKISDHSPVLMLGSTGKYDLGTYKAFHTMPAAAKKAIKRSQKSWSKLGERLDNLGLKAAETQGASQFDEIMGILAGPLDGPDETLIGALSKLALTLGESIAETGKTLSAEQKMALTELERWRPYYTYDVGEEAPDKDEDSDKDEGSDKDEVSGKGEGSGKKDPDKDEDSDKDEGSDKDEDSGKDEGSGKKAPGKDEDKKPGVPPGSGASGLEVDWGRGQIEWIANSCYLSALIHVFASHDAFSDLLDPIKNPISANDHPAESSFQRDSGLGKLVTALREPKAIIPKEDMKNFMTHLSTLGGMLVPRWGTAKEEVAKEASKKAVEATEKGETIGVQQDAAEILEKVLNKLFPSTEVAPVFQDTIRSLTGSSSWEVGSPLPFTTIQLPLGETTGSIGEALLDYTKPEPVDIGQEIAQHTKQKRFTSLPNVLTIVLGRFRYTEQTGRVGKIMREVKADETLKIPADSLSQTLKDSVGEVTYRLLHVVSHTGETPSGGHYISYGRTTSGQWYEHNDTRVGERRKILEPSDLTAALDTGYIYVYVRNP